MLDQRGLSCAIELAKAGCNVTIYEKEEKCGGILQYGIPDFRLSKKTIENLIKRVKELGIHIYNNIEFGKEVSLKDLKLKGFDNVFIAIGAQNIKTYRLTDLKAENVYKSDEFLKKYNKNEQIRNLGTTIIIGGGNVAFDSARAALRMGADKVSILYRRNKELMPARDVELNDALKEGIEIQYLTRVISAKVENEKITEIECIKTKIENDKAVDIENSNFLMKADTVIFAIGANIDEELFNKLEIKNENGLICVNKDYKTSIDNVYAGGDLVETKSSVCRAIATGKKAAKAILSNT